MVKRCTVKSASGNAEFGVTNVGFTKFAGRWRLESDVSVRGKFFVGDHRGSLGLQSAQPSCIDFERSEYA